MQNEMVLCYYLYKLMLTHLLVVVFLLRKNYLMLSLAMSVRPSVRLSVCPSVVCRNIFGTRLHDN